MVRHYGNSNTVETSERGNQRGAKKVLHDKGGVAIEDRLEHSNHVVGHALVGRDELGQRLVARRRNGFAGVGWQVRQRLTHKRESFFVAIGPKVSNSRCKMHGAAAERLFVDLLASGRRHQWRASNKQLSLAVHHDHQIAQRRSERAMTRRGTVHHSDRWCHTDEIGKQRQIGWRWPQPFGC